MNRPIAIALLQDAFAQVVDNLVFRLLVGVLFALVLPTFLIQLNPEGLRVLFFLDYRWDQLLGFFGNLSPMGSEGETHVYVIDWIQRFISDHLAGKVGVLLCVTATAFFVPRMLEKGAADTVFSKPVSRLTLMLSRYVAGLIFIAVLSTGLIGGMHLGFSLVSGHSMQGFLWSIPMLIYLFAIMHAFSVMVGVWTRSSVAAILLTVIFFFVNSCVHSGWELKQIATDSDLLEDLGEEELDLDDMPQFLRVLGGALSTAHYVLPKTRDARRIVELARDRLDRPAGELEDSESGLVVPVPPEGFTRDARSSIGRGGVLWTAPEPDGGEARVRLARRGPGHGSNRQAAAEQLADELTGNDAVVELEERRTAVANRSGHGVIWRESPSGELRHRERWFFENGEYLFELELDVDAERASDQAVQRFAEGFYFEGDHNGVEFDPWALYASRFGWGAELPYNAWVSLASTLLFVLLTLLAGWWRLSRIDF